MTHRRQTPVWPLLFAVALLVSGAPRVVRAVEVIVVDPSTCTVTKDPGAAPSDPINGTEGDDVICGTPGDDIINGLGGNDIIWGGGGNDTITGGAGTDTIYGEDGNDHIDGGEGDDTEYAGDGDDYVAGGPGADLLFGGDGSDALKGDTGNDTLNGEDGNDAMSGGSGNDIEYGGPGADRLFGGDGSDALLAEAGNDFIDGGPGIDTGSGGSGVDYCTKQTGEKISSCFNDASGPQLVSISVAPKSIDTSASTQKITVRMRIKDLGAGITGYCDEGAERTESGISCADWRVYASFTSGSREYFVGLDSRFCTSTGHQAEYGEESNGYFGGAMCRISGTPNDGIYEGAFWVKQYTPRATFKLDAFDAYDDAGNRSPRTKLSASFKQTSLGDGTGPQLISAAFCVPNGSGDCVKGATIDTSSSAQTVKLRVRIKDAGSGLNDRTTLDLATLPGANASVGRGGGLRLPPTFAPIRISGTANDGVYEQTYVVPKHFPKSTIYLIDFQATDLAGNTTRWGGDDIGAQLKKKGLRVSFKQVGAGDETPPAISGFSISPSSVDVSSSAAWLEVTYRMIDATSLYLGNNALYPNYDFSEFSGCLTDAGRNVNFCFGSRQDLLDSCPADLSQLEYKVCRVSGTAEDGVYKTSLLIPRNARKGKLSLSYLLAVDSLGNEVYYQPDLRTGIPRALNKSVTVQ